MKRSGIVVILNSIVGRFGVILIERHELWRMERDAEDYAEVSKREGIGQREGGYFNGLSDYAGKKAMQLRQRYTSNIQADFSASLRAVKSGLWFGSIPSSLRKASV